MPEIPPHLTDSFQRATKDKEHAVQWAVAETLVKHTEAFSRDDVDLGRTNRMEHTINTGNSRSLRQPPRKVPMAFEEDEKKVIETMQK